jgi:hypothetical protein
VKERFEKYIEYKMVSLHVGTDPELNTLEPNIVAVNDLETLNAALGAEFTTKEEVLNAMLKDKTGAALAIFESATKIVIPEYIRNVFS